MALKINKIKSHKSNSSIIISAKPYVITLLINIAEARPFLSPEPLIIVIDEITTKDTKNTINTKVTIKP